MANISYGGQNISLYVELEEKSSDKKLYRLSRIDKGELSTFTIWSSLRMRKNKVLVDEELIGKRCQSYFHECLNDGLIKALCYGDLENSEIHHNYGYCSFIKVDEVKGAICRMHKGKTTRPCEILMDFLEEYS